MLSPEHQTQFDAINREMTQLLHDGSTQLALDMLTSMIEAMGELEDYRSLRGALLARRAEIKLEEDDEEGAWEDAQKAMNLGWYDAAVHAIGGWAMLHMEQPQIALQEFTRSIEIDSSRARTFLGRALVHLDEEDFDAARDDLSKAIQLDASEDMAWATRAEVGIYLGTLEAALRDIEKARKIAPEDADHALMHARIALVLGKTKDALEALDHAVKSDEAALEALALRSNLRMQSKDLKAARADAIRATNAYPDEAFAFVALAAVQLAEGNGALALKAAERAVALDPTLPDGYLVRAAAHEILGNSTEREEDEVRVAEEFPELPNFLLGPLAEVSESFDLPIFGPSPVPATQPKAPASSPDAAAGGGMPGLGGMFPGLGGIPGLGGMNPAGMLDQIFDAEGNIKPAFKPIMKMALKNAPSLLKTMPPSMLESRGIDPKLLDGVDLDNISEEQLEEQMKLFYKMMKSQS